MPFRFPLKALLQIRSIYERREGQRLEVLTQHLLRTQRQLATLMQSRLDEAGSLAKGMKEGMTGAELQFQVACSCAGLKRIRTVMQAVEGINQQHKRQLIIYTQAHQKLEVVERLHDRQFSAYCKDQARRDYQQATDLFLIRSQFKIEGH